MRRAVGAASLIVLALAAPAGAASQPPTWNFTQAAVPSAEALGNYGAGVLVAVVDTWADFNDTEFGHRMVDVVDCQGANGSASACRDHTYAPDACTHGTHVSGTIASQSYGVAPEARILSIEVLGFDSSAGQCSGAPADVAAGIDWATTHGARVINLSVGDLVPLFFQDSSITAAISRAAAAGVVVAVAAGNSSVPFTDSYGSDAVMVAATGPTGQLASYSNTFTLPAGDVAMAAPGGDSGNGNCDPSTCVLSTWPANQLGLMEGTSMATPHVAGTAALLLGRNPGLTRQQVITALTTTASPVPGGGSGRLDTLAALHSVPAAPAAPAPPPAAVAAAPATARVAPSPGPAPQTTGPQPAPTVPGHPISVAPSPPVAPHPAGARPPSTSGGVAAPPAQGPPTTTTAGALRGPTRTAGSGGTDPAAVTLVMAAVAAAVGTGYLWIRRRQRPPPRPLHD